MPLSVHTALALSVTLAVLLQEGVGLPVPGQSPAPSAQSSARHVRTKRCSCNSWLDKECIYFCHLDIIWVNTPSKVLPYGLGSPLSRRRRSPGRCACAGPADTSCSSFCQRSLDSPSLTVAGPVEEAGSRSDTHSSNLLTSLRSMVKSNTASVELAAALRKRGAGLKLR